jgi:hypothetical protein
MRKTDQQGWYRSSDYKAKQSSRWTPQLQRVRNEFFVRGPEALVKTDFSE